MTFKSLNSTVAGLAVAATVLTTSLATVTTVSADPVFKLPPPAPNICVTKPWLCNSGNIKLPPKPPAPPPGPAPKPGMSAGTAAAIGIVGGIIVGTAIANANKKQQASANAQAHYNYCFAKFKTYRAEDNSFMSLSGVRKPCISPYI